MAPRHLVPSLVLALAAAGATSAAETTATNEVLTVEAEREQPPVTGTKTATPPLAQPQSLGVVDATLIREQHAVKLEDAIRNVAGVTVGGYYDDWDYFRIRGFDAAGSVRLDGLVGTPGTWIGEEVFGLERIEVLKGPGAMLYGSSSLGGLVNMVSKKPIHDDFAKATLSGGSFDFGEIGVDAGATLADDRVGVRLVALGRNRGSFVDDIGDSQRLYVAPSVTWWAGERTTITLLGHVIDDDLDMAWPLPASGFIRGNPNGDIPRERNVGEPEHPNHTDRRRTAIGYEFDHRFADAIGLRQNLRVTRFDSVFQGIYPQALQADQRTLDRAVYTYETDRLDVQADTMLDLRFATGAVRHDLLTGVDLMRGGEEAEGQYAAIGSLDIIAPVYGQDPGPLSPYTRPDLTTRSVGLYVQDQATIVRDVTVTAGLRWDRIDTDSTEGLTGVTSTSRDDALTWRVGAAWAFHAAASVFAGVSTAFAPQPYDRGADGERVDPETGDQVETGLRLLDPEGTCGATAAIFQIRRRDLATADPDHPGFSVVSGEQRSRGVELDGFVKPAKGISLSATYAFIKAVVTEDNTLPVGDRLRNVPDHSVTAWGRYTFQRGTLAGLGVGLGGRWYSSQAGDLPNTFELPAYGVVDAGLFYDRGPFSAQINLDNLFDKTYAVGSYNDVYVMPGDPRTVRGSVSWTF